MQLAAAFRYSAPLDALSPVPGALFDLGLRFHRFIGLFHGGFDSSVDGSSGGAKVNLRRVPLLLEAAYELPVPLGFVRLGAGPFLELWNGQSGGVGHVDRALTLHPGVFVAAAYHFVIARRVELFAAVDIEYSFVRESYTIDGLGTVSTTPTWWVCPSVGGALNFF